jgi:hypothetical protein
MFTQLNILLDRLTQADFLILVMEPLFYLGVFLGLFSFTVGFVLADNRARSTGLFIIAASCFALYPYLSLANKAAPRISAVTGSWTPAAMKTQLQRRQETRWVFYGMGCFAIVGLAASGSSAKVIGGTMIAAGFGVSFFGLWLHMKECEIYHPYIKQAARETPSVKQTKHATPVQPRARQ